MWYPAFLPSSIFFLFVAFFLPFFFPPSFSLSLSPLLICHLAASHGSRGVDTHCKRTHTHVGERGRGRESGEERESERERGNLDGSQTAFGSQALGLFVQPLPEWIRRCWERRPAGAGAAAAPQIVTALVGLQPESPCLC